MYVRTYAISQHRHLLAWHAYFSVFYLFSWIRVHADHFDNAVIRSIFQKS